MKVIMGSIKGEMKTWRPDPVGKNVSAVSSHHASPLPNPTGPLITPFSSFYWLSSLSTFSPDADLIQNIDNTFTPTDAACGAEFDVSWFFAPDVSSSPLLLCFLSSSTNIPVCLNTRY